MKLLYPLAKRFIAGHDFESAKPQIEKLLDEEYEVSIDYLGESSRQISQCMRATDQYLKIINYFWDRKINISIKPSQVGALINPVVSFKNLSKIARVAKKFGHTIRLDMEGSELTDLTRNQALVLNKKYGNVGVAIQANLFRTADDLKVLIKNNVSIRLVKGAYRESPEIAHQKEVDIECNFFHYAATLRSNKANKPAIATHDEDLLEDIEDLLPNAGRFDYEFLYGIRRDLQRGLKSKGYNVRVYVPFGKDWLPYTLRRLREWKNLKFVLKNVIKEWFR